MSTEQPADDNDDLRYFVRVGQTDLDGTKTVERALLDLTGIGRRATRVVASEVDVNLIDTLGLLDDEEIDDLVETIESFADVAPDWMANHRNEFFSGETTHRIGNDLELTRRQDINRMKMIDSYKGIRHEKGQKVRGQRTKSTGRTEGTIGVNIEEIKEEREAEAAEDDEDEGGL